MEEKIVATLMEKKWHICFAESCTGGMCASRLINVPDASKVLKESFVTYSDDAKIKYLGVKQETIDTYNVVSEDVAYEMAAGAALYSGSDVGVAITGIAGPGGASSDIPVGMVCFGFFIAGNVVTETVKFGNIGRNNVRKAACEHVYTRLAELL